MLNCVLLYKKFSQVGKTLQVKDFAEIIPICLSTLTRSNGVLNLGFLFYSLICLLLEKVKLRKQIFEKILCALSFSILGLFLASFCLLPFILFQLYSYQRFCKDFMIDLPKVVLDHKDIADFVLPGSISQNNQSWCYKTIPLSYSYIQSHYWKVGFLQYYQFKQIPNFLLATPIIYIILKNALKLQFPVNLSQLFNFHLMKFKKPPQLMLVFVIHATALTIFCIFNIHI